VILDPPGDNAVTVLSLWDPQLQMLIIMALSQRTLKTTKATEKGGIFFAWLYSCFSLSHRHDVQNFLQLSPFAVIASHPRLFRVSSHLTASNFCNLIHSSALHAHAHTHTHTCKHTHTHTHMHTHKYTHIQAHTHKHRHTSTHTHTHTHTHTPAAEEFRKLTQALKAGVTTVEDDDELILSNLSATAKSCLQQSEQKEAPAPK
jgi:hypothetical protein